MYSPLRKPGKDGLLELWILETAIQLMGAEAEDVDVIFLTFSA